MVLEYSFIIGDRDEGEVEFVDGGFESRDIFRTQTSERIGARGWAADCGCESGPVTGGVSEDTVQRHFDRSGLCDGTGDDGVGGLEEGIGIDCCAAG